MASSTRQKEPSLADLKGQVLVLAKVSSTKELKRANVDLRHLDFRLKTSWRSALEVLQQAAAASTSGLAVASGRVPQWRGDLFAGGLVSADVRRLRLDKTERVSSEPPLRKEASTGF